jgi:hypothetical protein
MVRSVRNGPLVQSTGPNDHEALGRERFWDMSEQQREDNLASMVKLASTTEALREPDKAYARGWLSEHRRYQQTKKTVSMKAVSSTVRPRNPKI